MRCTVSRGGDWSRALNRELGGLAFSRVGYAMVDGGADSRMGEVMTAVDRFFAKPLDKPCQV